MFRKEEYLAAFNESVRNMGNSDSNKAESGMNSMGGGSKADMSGNLKSQTETEVA